MGYLKCFEIFLAVYVVLLCIINSKVDCERTNKKIYTYLKPEYPCFRRLNATHQVGCSSSLRGNVGVVYYVANVTDLEWVLEHGPYSPYIIIIEPSYFNRKNLTKMMQSGKVSGVLVLSPTLTSYPNEFSPDHSCPNLRYGMYVNTSNYNGCSTQWNEIGDGTFFEDWTFPIFLVENEDDYKNLVELCYQKFNAPIHGKPRDWPLCAAQLFTNMYAAKDSKTCMRRSRMITNLNPVKYCDPLGDYNIWSTVLPMNKSEEIENRSIIVVAARMDSFSMFDNLGPGGDSAVSGLVALLATAEALSRVKKESITFNKNVLFIIFNGEAFDYLGSSRVVYDMENEAFPAPLNDDIISQPPLIPLNKISHFIEFNQVGIWKQNSPVYVHTDPISTSDPDVNSNVMSMINFLRDSGVVNVTKASSQSLPPASLQSFLKKDLHIPGIVIADHETTYTNKYYNSMYDGRQMNDNSSTYIDSIATGVSRLIYNLLTGQNDSSIAPSEHLVNTLLKCYLNLKECSLLNETSYERLVNLYKNPSLYVGVTVNSNLIRVFTTNLFAYLVGETLPNVTVDKCVAPTNDMIFSYRWMVGKEQSSGSCVKSTVNVSPARSPAFEIKDYDYDSGIYPTWTESVWDSFSLRIFLKPSLQQEVITLCTGLLVLILSFSTVWFISQNSNLLFSNNAEVVSAVVAC